MSDLPPVTVTPTSEKQLSLTSPTQVWCLASGVAALILTTVILPAEFGIDPTGFGRLTGLNALAQTEPAPAGNMPASGRYSQHEIQLSLPAGEDIEYKFQVAKGDKLAFQWDSAGQPLHVDFHGEPAGDTSGYFESYAVGEVTGLEGTLTAPFDGSHGWYWRNDSNQPITIELQVQGRFEVLGIR